MQKKNQFQTFQMVFVRVRLQKRLASLFHQRYHNDSHVLRSPNRIHTHILVQSLLNMRLTFMDQNAPLSLHHDRDVFSTGRDQHLLV